MCAPSAQLAAAGWAQAAGRSRSPREAAGSADATGNTAAGRQAQLELNAMPSWNKYIRVFSLRQHFFMLLCFLFLFRKYLFWLPHRGQRGGTDVTGQMGETFV